MPILNETKVDIREADTAIRKLRVVNWDITGNGGSFVKEDTIAKGKSI